MLFAFIRCINIWSHSGKSKQFSENNSMKARQ